LPGFLLRVVRQEACWFACLPLGRVRRVSRGWVAGLSGLAGARLRVAWGLGQAVGLAGRRLRAFAQLFASVPGAMVVCRAASAFAGVQQFVQADRTPAAAFVCSIASTAALFCIGVCGSLTQALAAKSRIKLGLVVLPASR